VPLVRSLVDYSRTPKALTYGIVFNDKTPLPTNTPDRRWHLQLGETISTKNALMITLSNNDAMHLTLQMTKA